MISKTLNYVKGSMQEMKKVTWPTKKETINYTVLVIAVSLIVAAFLGGLDFVFQKGLEMFLLG